MNKKYKFLVHEPCASLELNRIQTQPLALFYVHPLYVVFRFLLDEVHPLQNVGDVVEAALLDVERLGRLVQIHHAV